MRKLALSATFIVGVFSASAAISAEPSFRYCEAGYVRGFVDEAAGVQVGILGAVLVKAGNGGGGQAECKWSVAKGFYAHGVFRQLELAGLQAQGFPGPIIGPDALGNVSAKEWRVGIGYSVNGPFGAAAYGQVDFMRSNYYEDFAAASSSLFNISNPGARNGVSLEGGVRWLFADAVEIAGYGRWDSEGGYGFVGIPPAACCDMPGTLVFDDGDDFRAGARAAIRVSGPFWVTGGYEVGDIDAAFAGIRIAL